MSPLQGYRSSDFAIKTKQKESHFINSIRIHLFLHLPHFYPYRRRLMSSLIHIIQLIETHTGAHILELNLHSCKYANKLSGS